MLEIIISTENFYPLTHRILEKTKNQILHLLGEYM